MGGSFEIRGKTALVTGANRGIGKSIVETFLKNGAKKVYAGVRNVKSASPLVEKYGERVVPLHIDLEKPETIKRAAEKAGDVDIVVNNAGALRMSTPLDENAVEALQFEINVNVFGLMYMARAFAPILKANGGGVFIQLNSIASVRCFVGCATYSASKAAAYSITQGLRELLLEQNTLVISVHPGPIDTDMASDAGFSEIAEPADVVAEGIVEAMRQGRFHLFPDTLANKIGSAYQSFADKVVEADILAG